MMKTLASFCIAAAITFFGATAAHAQHLWGVNAGGCVIKDPGIDAESSGDHYLVATGGMRIKHKGTNTTDIVLVCPITGLSGTKTDMGIELFYANDGDGTGTDYSVKAVLRGVNKTTGTYASNLCTVTSNTTGSSWETNSCLYGTMNFNSTFYWVEITIHRAGTTYNPEVNAVQLAFVLDE